MANVMKLRLSGPTVAKSVAKGLGFRVRQSQLGGPR